MAASTPVLFFGHVISHKRHPILGRHQGDNEIQGGRGIPRPPSKGSSIGSGRSDELGAAGVRLQRRSSLVAANGILISGRNPRAAPRLGLRRVCRWRRRPLAPDLRPARVRPSLRSSQIKPVAANSSNKAGWSCIPFADIVSMLDAAEAPMSCIKASAE